MPFACCFCSAHSFLCFFLCERESKRVFRTFVLDNSRAFVIECVLARMSLSILALNIFAWEAPSSCTISFWRKNKSFMSLFTSLGVGSLYRSRLHLYSVCSTTGLCPHFLVWGTRGTCWLSARQSMSCFQLCKKIFTYIYILVFKNSTQSDHNRNTLSTFPHNNLKEPKIINYKIIDYRALKTWPRDPQKF